MTAGDEKFLSRWSRRKQAEGEAPAEEAPGTDDEPVSEGEEAAAFDPAELPDIDGLDKESDFTAFMKDGVPEELRNRALRKLWTTDPVFANLDGLNDYDEDFGEIMRTGAAAMRKFAAQEAEKARQAALAEADGDGEDGEEEEETAVDDTVPEAEESGIAGDGSPQTVADDDLPESA
ncbi:MAG: DUF3306 domain-containing protein [Alphaproteobacteria bacterium]